MAYNAAHHSFEFRPGQHDQMAAALTFQPEIHAYTQDFPLATAARMRFFHADDVAQLNLLFHPLFSFRAACYDGAVSRGDVR